MKTLGVLINASHMRIRNYNVQFWDPNLAVRWNKEISYALTARFLTVRKIRRLQVTRKTWKMVVLQNMEKILYFYSPNSAKNTKWSSFLHYKMCPPIYLSEIVFFVEYLQGKSLKLHFSAEFLLLENSLDSVKKNVYFLAKSPNPLIMTYSK